MVYPLKRSTCVSVRLHAHVCNVCGRNYTDVSALQRKCIAERDEAVAKLEAAQADLAQERARCMGCMVNACGHEPCHAFIDLEAQKKIGRPLGACKFVYRVMVDMLWQPAACKQVHVPMCHAVCKRVHIPDASVQCARARARVCCSSVCSETVRAGSDFGTRGSQRYVNRQCMPAFFCKLLH